MPSPLIALSYDLGSQVFSPIIMIIVTYKNVPLNTSPLPLTRPFKEVSTHCSNTRLRSKYALIPSVQISGIKFANLLS